MKNKLIIWLVLFSPLSLAGQNVDSLIRDIRAEYSLIVKNKESYKKTVLNIDLNGDPIFEDGQYIYIDDGIFKEMVITYYIDGKNNQIKLISLYDGRHMPTYQFEANLTEYYLKDSNLFFIYRQTKNNSDGRFENIEDVITTATESRIYTVGDIDYQWTYVPKASYYSINNCIRYLVKSTEGKLSDITGLLQKTANTEIDCSKSTEEEIRPSVKDLMDIYYGRDKSVKISNEPPPTYFYNLMFGQ